MGFILILFIMMPAQFCINACCFAVSYPVNYGFGMDTKWIRDNATGVGLASSKEQGERRPRMQHVE